MNLAPWRLRFTFYVLRFGFVHSSFVPSPSSADAEGDTEEAVGQEEDYSQEDQAADEAGGEVAGAGLGEAPPSPENEDAGSEGKRMSDSAIDADAADEEEREGLRCAQAERPTGHETPVPPSPQ